jgi:NAD(P)-dependent dehydrogenase (short-subunit alcohol dehydrogenase family)
MQKSSEEELPMTSAGNTSTSDPSTGGRRVLVTGASSGLGFEAAAQLADQGFDSVVITARNEAKATKARAELTDRTGRDLFETVAVDLSRPASTRAAAEELIGRGRPFDAVLLNAGAVMAERVLTPEGLETTFAASIFGHHLLTSALLDGNMLADEARIVIVGSEAANNDLPGAMGFKVFDFALEDTLDEARFIEAFTAFTQGREPAPFQANNQYATTKVVSAWWAGAMQRRHPEYSFFNVSPGANLGTNAARHMTGPMKLMFGLMARIGHLIGMNQPVSVGARRYVDVLTANGQFTPGGTYTSGPKKMVGDLTHRTEPWLVEQRRQDLALDALDASLAELPRDLAS